MTDIDRITQSLLALSGIIQTLAEYPINELSYAINGGVCDYGNELFSI